ncbi:MAG: DUF86 domain-containing protein [Clostridia bacterium]|nr:DUF86 domain-containing protein [Clostridia bacterium]
MERRDRIILQKVLSEIGIAQEMMDSCTVEQFRQNEMLKRAVGMTVINIGELVKNLSDEARTAYAHIPWKAIAGFRDIAAHKYQTLRMEDVYETVITDFPSLKKQIEEILNQPYEIKKTE